MSSLFSKALVYLGLVDEDQIDAEATQQGMGAPEQQTQRGVDQIPEGRRVEPPPTARAATGRIHAPAATIRAARCSG